MADYPIIFPKQIAAMTKPELPRYSDAAHAAGVLIESPCVVLLSINPDTMEFETRCFGDSELWRYLAGRMSEEALKALAVSNPTEVDDTIADTLSLTPDGGKTRK